MPIAQALPLVTHALVLVLSLCSTRLMKNEPERSNDCGQR
jgi:hypothetical protein